MAVTHRRAAGDGRPARRGSRSSRPWRRSTRRSAPRCSWSSGAGELSNIPDEEFDDSDARRRAATRSPPTWSSRSSRPRPTRCGLLRAGAVLVGLLQPYSASDSVAALRDAQGDELRPRAAAAHHAGPGHGRAHLAGRPSPATRRCSCRACLAGRYFPMLTTPAGTLRPAKVVVLGVGVAGLQAIATARRLGAHGRGLRRARRDARAGAVAGRALHRHGHRRGGRRRLRARAHRRGARQGAGRRRRARGGRRRRDHHGGRARQAARPAHHQGRGGAHEAGRRDHRPRPPRAAATASSRGPASSTVTGGVFIYGPLNVPAMLPLHATDQYARNLMHFLTPFVQGRRAGAGLGRRDRWPAACSPATARSSTKPPGGSSKEVRHDRRLRRRLHLHARGVHRLRGHLPRAGDPAHAAHVGLQLRPRHRRRGRHGRARRGATRRPSASSASSPCCSARSTPSAVTP